MKSILILLGIVSSPGLAQTVDPAAVTRILADPNSLDAPGCVAGAYRNGEPIFVSGAGAADIQQRRPLDGDSLFYAASVSKQFTALAAAKLIEQGKLSLEDDARKYLPELPQYAAPITVGMLMHHTSGIRDWISLLEISGGDMAAASRAEMLSLLFKQRNTSFTPGSRWSYSNGGYLLLSEIVARVSGMPFEAYAKKAILKPLRMNRSMFLNGDRPQAATLVSGYAPAAGRFELRNNFALISGSGGLMTTINDLARYERDLAKGGKVWTAAARRIMLTPGKLTSGEPAVTSIRGGYGGGLMIGERFGHKFVMHPGGSEGFLTLYARIPERQLGVIVSCNRNDVKLEQKAGELIELIEGDILTAPGKSDGGTNGPAAASSAAQPAQVAGSTAKVPENVAGRYMSDEIPAVYLISRTAGQLEVTILSPHAPAAGKRLSGFTALPSGSFKSGSLQIKFDPEGGGFLVSEGLARNIRFYRAP